MSVELEPAELGFRRPFTQEVSQTLRLKNPSSDPVAFKVKTTAPKQYCVRPNSGRIDPGKDVEVQVLLQAMKEDPPLDAKCRDKFLVQSVTVEGDNDTNVSQIWSKIEQNNKSSIQEKKIRVSFLPADGSATSAAAPVAAGAAVGAGGAAAAAAAATATTNGVKHEDEPPAYSSPPPAALPSQQQAEKDISNAAADDTTTADSSTFAAATSVIPTSQEDLKAQLEEAKATIARLQTQVQDGLRQRKPQEAAEKVIESAKQSMQNAPAPGGVPIQIVAGLCLLCFLIAYLFF